MKKSTVGILGTIGVAIIGALAFGATARTNNLNQEVVIDEGTNMFEVQQDEE